MDATWGFWVCSALQKTIHSIRDAPQEGPKRLSRRMGPKFSMAAYQLRKWVQVENGKPFCYLKSSVKEGEKLVIINRSVDHVRLTLDRIDGGS